MLIPVLRPLFWQAGVVGVAALIGGVYGEAGTALAVLFGGGVAVVNTSLLLWRWRQGSRDYHCDAGRHLRSFYRSSLERFFVVVILLAAGFALLGTNSLALLAGFLVGQIAWIAMSQTLRERT